MKKKQMKNMLALLIVAAIPSLTQANEVATESGVYYSIQLNEAGNAYQIMAEPNQTPNGDISLTGQITIKVPHGADADTRFMAAEVTSHVDGIQWIESSRVNAPQENSSADYLSFSFTTANGAPNRFQWKVGENKPLFSFKNSSGCLGEISLMDNEDPYNQQPNSVSSNPGNQFSNLGWGGLNRNHYLGNTGAAAPCPTVKM